jgi:hypothetical protein
MKSFYHVLDYLQSTDPMKWPALFVGMDINEECLRGMREWLGVEWYEKVLLEDEYPEFAFMEDDGVILDMQHEMLAALN